MRNTFLFVYLAILISSNWQQTLYQVHTWVIALSLSCTNSRHVDNLIFYLDNLLESNIHEHTAYILSRRRTEDNWILFYWKLPERASGYITAYQTYCASHQWWRHEGACHQPHPKSNLRLLLWNSLYYFIILISFIGAELKPIIKQ